MRQNKRNSKRATGIGLLMGAMVSGLGLFSSFAPPVQAQDLFGNQVIQFPVDTTVEFEFKASHGAFQSTLGILDLETGQPVAVLFREVKPYDSYRTGQPQPRTFGQSSFGTSLDHLGTVEGGTVPNRFSEFTFQANRRYGFYLESVSPTGQTRRTVLSSNNSAALFKGSLDGGSRGGMTGSRIYWDDDGLPGVGKDNDFDDFIIEAGGYLIEINCP